MFTIRNTAAATLALTLALAPAATTATAAHAATTSPSTPAAAAVTKVSKPLRTAINGLPLASEVRTGYARSKFTHWIDANGDCQDTRSEVLRAETKAAVTGRCGVSTGKWFSYYDGKTWTRASDVDIDHLVALAEAWDSGARKWNADTRKRFANDLGDSRALVAVTDDVNQAKGDRDPASWLPAKGKCRYITEWTATKIRWSLTVDRKEKTALQRVAAGCANKTLTVTKARIVTGTSSGGTTSPAPSTGGTDPRFSTCTAAKAAGYGPYVRGRDAEYPWYEDRDGDGVVCE